MACSQPRQPRPAATQVKQPCLLPELPTIPVPMGSHAWRLPMPMHCCLMQHVQVRQQEWDQGQVVCRGACLSCLLCMDRHQVWQHGCCTAGRGIGPDGILIYPFQRIMTAHCRSAVELLIRPTTLSLTLLPQFGTSEALSTMHGTESLSL